MIPTELSKLSSSALTVFAVTQLHTCHLTDAVTLNEAAELLPTSLRKLHLTYQDIEDSGYTAKYAESDHEWEVDIGSMLASFTRLPNLKTLCV